MSTDAAVRYDLKPDDDLYARFVAWRSFSRLTLNQLCNRLNRGAKELSQYIDTGACTPALEAQIRRFLQREEGKTSGEKRGLIRTGPALEIMGLLGFCRRFKMMGGIFCSSGLGKTTCALENKRLHEDDVYVLCSIAEKSPSAFLRLLSHEAGSTPRDVSCSYLMDNLERHLRGSHRLLILDEAHTLRHETLELFRSLVDRCGVGAVLLGQEAFWDRVKRNASRVQLFDQFLSRLAIVKLYFEVTREDVKLISESLVPTLGSDKAAIDYLFSLAQGIGKFRAVSNLLIVARDMAEHHNVPVDHQLLLECSRLQGR